MSNKIVVNVGDVFGNLKVVEIVKKENDYGKYYKCSINGTDNFTIIRQDKLLKYNDDNLYKATESLTIGETYNNLIVLKEIEGKDNKYKRKLYLCTCKECCDNLSDKDKCKFKLPAFLIKKERKNIYQCVDPHAFVDLTGCVFGNLKVLGFDHKRKDGKSVWKCLCLECNKNISYVDGTALKSGTITHCYECGHKQAWDKRINDLTGKRFGKLTVIKMDDHNRIIGDKEKIKWICECDCGNIVSYSAVGLISGQCTSCGCGRITHGMSNSPEYSAWNSIKQRCYNPNNPKYPDYGARGITMCDRWKDSFENFYEDMGPRPIGKEREFSINRIDNDGNYEPGNCEWSDAYVQQNNTRLTNKYKYAGEYYSRRELLNKFCDPDLKFETLRARLNKYGIDDGDTIDFSLTSKLFRNEEYRKDMIKPIHFIGDNDQPNISFNNLSNFTINEDGNISQ